MKRIRQEEVNKLRLERKKKEEGAGMERRRNEEQALQVYGIVLSLVFWKYRWQNVVLKVVILIFEVTEIVIENHVC